MPEKRRVLVGITGGIAAYKVPQLIRMLGKRGADVKTLCTTGALRFVGDETLRTVSGHPLYRDGTSFYDIEHVRLAEWAEVFIICPATANTIAKIACGIADNLLTTVALSVAPNKLLIAPAMNSVMWESAATQKNIAELKKRGVRILPVGEGELACSASGPGRMIELEAIADAVISSCAAKGPFEGKRLLISSGPTEEPLDPVRVITNRSSGKMGAALARAGLALGAKVTVVSGPATEPLPSGAHLLRVTTTDEMRSAMKKEFGKADICIMAAAVSDFKPLRFSKTKIRRNPGKPFHLELETNPDILAELGSRKGKRFLVGFALETSDDMSRALRKMNDKRCDMVIGDRPETSLGSDATTISIISSRGEVESCPVMEKKEAALCILRRIADCLGLSHER